MSVSSFEKFQKIQSDLLQVNKNNDDETQYDDVISLDFRDQLGVDFLEKDYWNVLLYLYNNGKTNIVKICDDLEFPDRDNLCEKVIIPLHRFII